MVLLIVFAITMASLETVFNFLGAVACNLVDILLPTFFYFILCEKVKKMKFENARKRFFYYFVKAYFVFGLVILVVCVTSEILKTIS